MDLASKIKAVLTGSTEDEPPHPADACTDIREARTRRVQIGQESSNLTAIVRSGARLFGGLGGTPENRLEELHRDAIAWDRALTRLTLAAMTPEVRSTLAAQTQAREDFEEAERALKVAEREQAEVEAGSRGDVLEDDILRACQAVETARVRSIVAKAAFYRAMAAHGDASRAAKAARQDAACREAWDALADVEKLAIPAGEAGLRL